MKRHGGVKHEVDGGADSPVGLFGPRRSWQPCRSPRHRVIDEACLLGHAEQQAVAMVNDRVLRRREAETCVNAAIEDPSGQVADVAPAVVRCVVDE